MMRTTLMMMSLLCGVATAADANENERFACQNMLGSWDRGDVTMDLYTANLVFIDTVPVYWDAPDGAVKVGECLVSAIVIDVRELADQTKIMSRQPG